MLAGGLLAEGLSAAVAALGAGGDAGTVLGSTFAALPGVLVARRAARLARHRPGTPVLVTGDRASAIVSAGSGSG